MLLRIDIQNCLSLSMRRPVHLCFLPLLNISHSYLLSSFQQPYETKTHFTDMEPEAQKFAQGPGIQNQVILTVCGFEHTPTLISYLQPPRNALSGFTVPTQTRMCILPRPPFSPPPRFLCTYLRSNDSTKQLAWFL